MITNEQFSTAWENKDNRRIMNHAIRGYRDKIPYEEIDSCKMIGLWECLKKYDKTRGRKFTTYLYCGIQLQCKKQLSRFDYITIGDVASYMDFNRIYIRDCVDKLDFEYKELVYNRYFEGKTLREIAKENSYSIETARRKIKKALCKLKKMLTK
jgi:RNA polymerase sigma factor (sigma-70 family)